jgi:RNA 3'-terminal phosphate cyclase (ATP)
MIDGSRGEGGGQILRTSLALSCVTGRSVRIVNIRARRRRPGLRRQHRTALEAAAEISGADFTGGAVGGSTLEFRPGEVRPGEYHFDVGTAGSATLVFQTILPALATAAGESRVVVEGGTHNPWSPPFDFLQRTYLPLLNRMGPEVEVSLERPGFYPAGGGRFSAVIRPAPLAPLRIEERGEVLRCEARATVAGLPRRIAERELKVVRSELGWTETRILEEAGGPGNVLVLEVESEALCEVFTGFGRKGVPAREVAASAVEEVRAYLSADVPVGHRLADQLMLPLALAGEGSYVSQPLSSHARTNLDVIGEFTGRSIGAEPLGGERTRVFL